MAAKSFFQRQLALAMAELSAPINSTKITAAFKAAKKTIDKSRIAYQWHKENP